MSVLTKVFVVLLTVFSIALSMLVVAAFAKQEDWRASAMDWQAKSLAADAKARTITENAAIEQQRSLTAQRDYVAQISELRDRQIGSVSEIADLERSLANAENQLTVEQGQATSLSQQNGVILADLNAERQLSSKLVTRNAEVERRNIDLNDRVKELTSDMTMASSQIRSLKQQIVAMGDTAGLSVASQIPSGPATIEAGIPTARVPSMVSLAGSQIRGEITQVDGNLASISVGSADGVAPGMVFLIYRPGRGGSKPIYLGSLRITKVEAGLAAGLIEQSVGDIRPGDAARDELSFAMRG